MESVLAFAFITYFSNLGAEDKNRVKQIVKLARKMTATKLPDLTETYIF